MASLDQKIDRLKATAARKVAEAKTSKKVEPNRQLKLELWPEEVRGVPNAILRGALFGVSRERKYHTRRTLIATTGQYEIRFMGETFNQSDLDVFENLLHLAMPHPLGTRVEFSTYSLLKILGRGTSGKHQSELQDQIARLVSGTVEITDVDQGKTLIAHLMRKAFRDNKTGRYVVVFEDDMLDLYKSGYTNIDHAKRMDLGSNSIAAWLYRFYSTHAAPFPYKVSTLHQLCGSADKKLFSFRQKLKKALDELVRVEAIESWSIGQDDLVTVQRPPSKSQRKHLNRAAKRT
jgi:hypothetical protein